jgi:hypothetical protein
MTKHFFILLEVNDEVDHQKIYQTFNDNIKRDPTSTLPKANLQIYSMEKKVYDYMTKMLVKMGAVVTKTE